MKFLFAIILFLLATLAPAQALRQVGTSTHPIAFLMVSSTDHVAAVTGITPTVTISKDGASFAVPSGAVTEIGNGWYALAGNATDRNTLGAFLVHASGTGCDPTDVRLEIVAYDPFDSAALGLSRLDAAVSSRSTLTQAQVNTEADTALSDAGVTPTVMGRLDAAITTRQPSGAVALQAGQHVIADTIPNAVLDASQPNYAPAKAGDSMVSINERGTDNALLASGYMAPPTVAAIQSGLATEANATSNRAAVIAAMPAAAPTVNEILAGAVDGSVDLKTALRRLLAAVYNSATVTGSTDKTIQLKDSGGSNAGTQVIKGDGSGRVTIPQ